MVDRTLCERCPPGYAEDAPEQGRACAPCAVNPFSLSANGAAGPAIVTRSSPFTVVPSALSAAAASPSASGCNTAGRYTFSWSASDPSVDAAVGAAQSASLTVPAGTLPPDTEVTFTLTACLAPGPGAEPLPPTACASSSSAPVRAAPSPLLPALTGGGGEYPEGTPVTFDASASADPDNSPGSLSFSWSCQADVGACPGAALPTLPSLPSSCLARAHLSCAPILTRSPRPPPPPPPCQPSRPPAPAPPAGPPSSAASPAPTAAPATRSPSPSPRGPPAPRARPPPPSPSSPRPCPW